MVTGLNAYTVINKCSYVAFSKLLHLQEYKISSLDEMTYLTFNQVLYPIILTCGRYLLGYWENVVLMFLFVFHYHWRKVCNQS